MRPSGTSGSCRWTTSCCGRVPAQRSAASLWRRGGRDDDGAALRSRAGVSTVGGSRSAFYARRARCSVQRLRVRAAAGRRPRYRMRSCWRRFVARSPFREGHRKVHARLRILDGVRVSRTRVLRVMRGRACSRRSRRQGEPKPHDGTIVTSARRHVGYRWRAGVDRRRRLGLDLRGHRPLECRVCGMARAVDRFAALEPVAQGLRRRSGSVEADAARGLSLRMDHGSQYLSDHFLNQVRYWGIPAPASACSKSRRPTASERWNRTLKERSSTAGSFKISPTCAPPSPSER